jgi:hypothetical protein
LSHCCVSKSKKYPSCITIKEFDVWKTEI